MTTARRHADPCSAASFAAHHSTGPSHRDNQRRDARQANGDQRGPAAPVSPNMPPQYKTMLIDPSLMTPELLDFLKTVWNLVASDWSECVLCALEQLYEHFAAGVCGLRTVNCSLSLLSDCSGRKTALHSRHAARKSPRATRCLPKPASSGKHINKNSLHGRKPGSGVHQCDEARAVPLVVSLVS
eukprot:150322-Chlamydomonas_euryale.AAC.4